MSSFDKFFVGLPLTPPRASEESSSLISELFLFLFRLPITTAETGKSIIVSSSALKSSHDKLIGIFTNTGFFGFRSKIFLRRGERFLGTRKSSAPPKTFGHDMLI